MKKLLSVLLVLSLMLTVAAPMAFASEDERTPIVFIRGNGETLYDAEGNVLSAGFDSINFDSDDEEEDDGSNKIVEACVNILKPFVLEGMLFDNWDNYGRAIYEELAPIFEDAGLDENGNAKNGTGVDPVAISNSIIASNERYLFDGNSEYRFIYDWRLSPYDHVDRLHEFITNILTATEQTQVSIYARCIGGGLLNAYLEKYGHLGHVKNVMYCEILSNEATIISKAMSGKIEFDGKLTENYLGQLNYCGIIDEGMGFVIPELVHEIVFATLDLFTQTYGTDLALGAVEKLYERLYKALIPAILHASGMATQANFWTCISEEDFDDALNLVFGEENSELRIKYKGLIDKILYYRERISSDLTGFYDSLREKGIHIGFTAKYGFMNAPFTEDADILSDSLASLEHATLGATCASLNNVLSDEYIEARIAEGKGKYISADRQVDLSTAYSPDTTWVLKNAHHDTFAPVVDIVKEFLNGTNETVDTVKSGTQFMIYDYETGVAAELTEENNADLGFMSLATEKPDFRSVFAAVIRFWKAVAVLLKNLFAQWFAA